MNHEPFSRRAARSGTNPARPANRNVAESVAVLGHLGNSFGFDFLLLGRLIYLAGEHLRLGRGAIGEFLLRCAARTYQRFSFTDCPNERHAAWGAVSKFSAWLAQLEEGMSS